MDFNDVFRFKQGEAVLNTCRDISIRYNWVVKYQLGADLKRRFVFIAGLGFKYVPRTSRKHASTIDD